ncbi:DUF4276 family protein [Flavobacterium branchiophilum]|uniref:Uncharacterized protein n=1 Tax=Flavobacterium branchiophilum TaxID=55197 RepID=A0A2H3KLB0_9FLAO|nr:hypothetical protein B0A77_02590 [Flavobacterium branchiophilum]
MRRINIKNAVVAICNQYPNIEDINSGFGPSERLETIYKQNGKKYNKIIDGMDIAELTGIEKMLEKSYRFRIWIEKLTTELLKNC